MSRTAATRTATAVSMCSARHRPRRHGRDRGTLRGRGTRDFHTVIDGSVRLRQPLVSHLAMTASLWRVPADDAAAWIATRLRGEKARLKVGKALPNISTHGHQLQSEVKRHALRWRIGGIIEVPIPKICAECG